MNKNEFISYAAKEIMNYIPEDMREGLQINPMTVVKINDQKLNGLSFYREDGVPQPTIYVDEAYERYCDGMPAEEIFKGIAESYQDACNAKAVPVMPDLEYQNVRDKFAFRLLEASRNRDYLRNVPYMDVGNGLVMICDIRIGDGGEGHYSTVVNNDLLRSFGCEKSDVFRSAMENAWTNDAPVFSTMESKLFPFAEPDNLFDPDCVKTEHEPMYVLTTKSSIHGAAALFYPDVQEKISDMLEQDYYAIPSSVHEWIIIPASTDISRGELSEMVKSVNSSMVDPKEVLSDQLLIYDRNAKALQLANADRGRDSQANEMRC